MRKHSKLSTIIDNTPYIGMLVIGAVAITFATSFSYWGIVGAIGYMLYGAVSSLWIMIFVCPYCHGYGNNGCPSGYGKISAKMVKKKEQKYFAQKFRKHIALIVPLWIIPAICGVAGLIQSFSWLLLFLTLIFVVEGWIILPMLSKKQGCSKCTQKKQCPWMK